MQRSEQTGKLSLLSAAFAISQLKALVVALDL